MPSIYDLKPAFQHLLRPIVGTIAHAGITANQVTLLAAAISIAVGAIVARWSEASWPLLLIAPTLLIRMALNAVDGMLAREHNMKSRLGGMLNELGDVVSDAALYLPLALVPGFNSWLVVVFAVLAVITEMAGVLGVTIGADRRYDGPLGKSDRAALIGALTLAVGFGVPTGRWLDVILGIAVALMALTILNRTRAALRSPPRGEPA